MAVKQNDIRIGDRYHPFLSLNNSDIISIHGNLSCDLLCEQLPIDTLEIQCRYRGGDAESFPDIPYATGLWYFNDNKYIGKFYVSDAKRTGKTVYTITAQSTIGVLDGMKYYGKMFINATLLDVLNDIVLTDGLVKTNTPFLAELFSSIILSDGLESVNVSGWIPVCTKREALHHVLFAQGLNIFKSENDSFLISRVYDAVIGSIDPKNEYDTGTMDLLDRVKQVNVTEHSFVPNQNAESVVLYDNTENAIDVEAVVFFDSAPIVTSTVSKTGTITVKQINENCALISGVGTLTGKPYSHTSLVLSRDNSGIIDGETVSVSDATLVNSLNSNVVADRLFAYYTQRQQMQLPIVLEGERCGLKYSFISPYGDDVDAYIASISINASAIAKADCKMISGYVPPKGSGEFSHVVLLTSHYGTFQVPEEVLNSDNPRIRFVLIGGGQGGYAGESGEDGPKDVVESIDQLAKPGNPGKNGTPGKMLIVQFDGDKILSSYRYCCGYGGRGQSESSNPPREGEPTYLYDYDDGGTETIIASTENGAISEAGYLDILTGNRYGGYAPDYSNVKPGRGGGFVRNLNGATFPRPFAFYVPPEGGYYVVNKEISEIDGTPIGSIQYAEGGTLGGDAHDWEGTDQKTSRMFPGYYDGAGGGGPITSVTYWGSQVRGFPTYIYSDPGMMAIERGAGGFGSSGVEAPYPMDISPTAYGQGGIGGMGGAGGGGDGVLNPNLDFSAYYIYTSGFVGGFGGKGSNGAPGCILVYY